MWDADGNEPVEVDADGWFGDYLAGCEMSSLCAPRTPDGALVLATDAVGGGIGGLDCIYCHF